MNFIKDPVVRALQEKDLHRLREEFYRVFDPSLIGTALAKMYSDGKDFSAGAKFSFAGEGRHFMAYRVSAQAGVAAKITLSMNILKRSFALPAGETIARGDGAGGLAWQEKIKKLATQKLSLIPPLELVLNKERLAVVMPFGDQPLHMAAPHWQPIASVVRDTLVQLNARHLALDDVPQGRCWESIPFLCDFSDL